jgi:predicted patatin/cPLA2 family phospholipase
LFGRSPEKVLTILYKRKLSNYEAGSHSDGSKLALVVEGGGMRGVISSAMLEAIKEMGYSNCFDSIYGTSAGAINAAYFLTGKPEVGTSIYLECIANKNFISLFRMPNIMDLDYLFNFVKSDKNYKLETDKIWQRKEDFVVTTTRLDNGMSENWNKQRLRSPERLISALKASSSTPLFTSNFEVIDGLKLNDGMINNGIPLEPAIEDGATHILCLLTRDSEYRKKESMILELIEKLILKKFTTEYQKSYFSRLHSYNNAMDTIYLNSKIPIMAIPTDGLTTTIKNGEINTISLKQAAYESRKVCHELMQQI